MNLSDHGGDNRILGLQNGIAEDGQIALPGTFRRWPVGCQSEILRIPQMSGRPEARHEPGNMSVACQDDALCGLRSASGADCGGFFGDINSVCEISIITCLCQCLWSKKCVSE